MEYLERPSVMLERTMYDKAYYEIDCRTMLNHLEILRDGETSCCCTTFLDERLGSVLDYNKETKICKVHAVLHDTQGVDAIDMTADVNVNPNGNLAVISADITRLKEYDSSLDRQGILYAN